MSTWSYLKKLPRSVWVVMLGLWAISLGSFMIIPFFSIFLSTVIGLSTVQIGMALTAKLWAQQGLTFVGGVSADRLGTKITMFMGLILRGLSYIGIAQSSTAVGVIVWSILMGFGSALYTPAGKAALVQMSNGLDRTLVFSIRNTFTNLGVALGPLLGAVAIFTNPQYVFLIVAAIYLVFAGFTLWLVPTVKPQQTYKGTNWGLYRELLKNKGIWYLMGVSVFFMMFYTQMELTMPLFTKQRFSEWGVSMLFTVNAIAVILLQIPLSTWLARKHTTEFTLFFGISTMAVGMLLFGASQHLLLLLFAVLIFSMGEVTVEPRVDADITKLVHESSIGTAFGLMGVVTAVGGAIGNTLGGALYSQFEQSGHPEWFWYCLGALGLLISILIVMGKKRKITSEGELQLKS